VIGISADEPAPALEAEVRRILDGLVPLLGVESNTFAAARVEIDDTFAGEGYGIPTPESRAAIELAASTEALFLDPTYTSKAMAGLLAHVRGGTFDPSSTILFWHTGGQVGLFA
jgi:1-aminocyclopropane-1-carboxylate deaminase/D-cysteine desulfhydrase-like pyridoxal-dependent ACC family enzyme